MIEIFKRSLDWKKIACIDVENFLEKLSFEALQEILHNITNFNFDATGDDLSWCYVKLMKVMQRFIHHLLESQEVLIQKVDEMKEGIMKEKEKHSRLEKEIMPKLKESIYTLKLDRKEKEDMMKCQQQIIEDFTKKKEFWMDGNIMMNGRMMMNGGIERGLDVKTDAGKTTLKGFKCFKCLKIFISQEYLINHVQRRHNNNTGVINTDIGGKPGDEKGSITGVKIGLGINTGNGPKGKNNNAGVDIEGNTNNAGIGDTGDNSLLDDKIDRNENVQSFGKIGVGGLRGDGGVSSYVSGVGDYVGGGVGGNIGGVGGDVGGVGGDMAEVSLLRNHCEELIDKSELLLSSISLLHSSTFQANKNNEDNINNNNNEDNKNEKENKIQNKNNLTSNKNNNYNNSSFTAENIETSRQTTTTTTPFNPNKQHLLLTEQTSLIKQHIMLLKQFRNSLIHFSLLKTQSPNNQQLRSYQQQLYSLRQQLQLSENALKDEQQRHEEVMMTLCQKVMHEKKLKNLKTGEVVLKKVADVEEMEQVKDQQILVQQEQFERIRKDFSKELLSLNKKLLHTEESLLSIQKTRVPGICIGELEDDTHTDVETISQAKRPKVKSNFTSSATDTDTKRKSTQEYHNSVDYKKNTTTSRNSGTAKKHSNINMAGGRRNFSRSSLNSIKSSRKVSTESDGVEGMVKKAGGDDDDEDEDDGGEDDDDSEGDGVDYEKGVIEKKVNLPLKNFKKQLLFKEEEDVSDLDDNSESFVNNNFGKKWEYDDEDDEYDDEDDEDNNEDDDDEKKKENNMRGLLEGWNYNSSSNKNKYSSKTEIKRIKMGIRRQVEEKFQLIKNSELSNYNAETLKEATKKIREKQTKNKNIVQNIKQKLQTVLHYQEKQSHFHEKLVEAKRTNRIGRDGSRRKDGVDKKEGMKGLKERKKNESSDKVVEKKIRKQIKNKMEVNTKDTMKDVNIPIVSRRSIIIRRSSVYSGKREDDQDVKGGRDDDDDEDDDDDGIEDDDKKNIGNGKNDGDDNDNEDEDKDLMRIDDYMKELYLNGVDDDDVEDNDNVYDDDVVNDNDDDDDDDVVSEMITSLSVSLGDYGKVGDRSSDKADNKYGSAEWNLDNLIKADVIKDDAIADTSNGDKGDAVMGDVDKDGDFMGGVANKICRSFMMRPRLARRMKIEENR